MITDKIINDFLDIFALNKDDYPDLKDTLKDMGNEVEEKKSRLDLANEYKLVIKNGCEECGLSYTINSVTELIILYQDAIKEIQEQHKKDIPQHLIEWLDRYSKEGLKYYTYAQCINNAKELLSFIRK
jgi:hypothetical protein